MKMRKTPNKWAIMVPKNDPTGDLRAANSDNLGSQKSQNALKTGGQGGQRVARRRSRNERTRSMKMRKTPNKWAIMLPINDPPRDLRAAKSDNLGCQKSQNAL